MSQLPQISEDLYASWKMLQARYDQVMAVWNDEVASGFHQHEWEPLERAVRHLQQDLNTITQVVERAEADLQNL